jgi:hypothetical protein
MRWMIDFDRAEAAGMALRLTLPTPAVDVLLVAGVADGDRSTALAAQLDAHRYTDGLAFMPPASATNNTATGRTPYQEPDPQHEKSFAREWDSTEATAGSSADLVSKAFGVRSFSRLASGHDQDDAAARAMATALWPATWGYFFAQMVGFDGTGLTLAGRDWARAHARDHLRPGGPLPVLRVGRQPYGVLPVTSLDSWTTAEAAGTRLRDVLRRLRDAVFRPASMGVPRVGRSDDPSADLVDVLQVGALSSSYRVRALMGQHFLQHLRAFLGEDLDAVGFWQRLVQLSSRLPTQLGLGVPALARDHDAAGRHAVVHQRAPGRHRPRGPGRTCPQRQNPRPARAAASSAAPRVHRSRGACARPRQPGAAARRGAGRPRAEPVPDTDVVVAACPTDARRWTRARRAGR